MAREYTKKEFLEYKQSVRNWMKKFGMASSWNIDFKQRTIGDGISGNTTYNTVSRNACFQLAEVQTGDYCLHDNMDELGLHEVLHLLLADLVWTTKEMKDDAHDLVIAKEHEVLLRLIPVLMGNVE